MGKNFEVESKTDEDHFQIDVNVEQWKAKTKKVTIEEGIETEEDDWSFNYTNITPETSNLDVNGTYIKVTNLYEEVSNTFDNEFLDELQDDIERLLNFSLEKGLKITLNGKELNKKGIVLFQDTSEPYYFEGEFNNVRFRVVAGLSNVGDPKASGWYIYCNDRLVLEADTSIITGWGSGGIPKFHVDYVMFKGVVFFESKDTIKLPLTTTKKGIDATSEIYKKAQFYMKEALSNVLGFLKNVRKLGDEANDYRTLLGEQEDKIAVIAIKDRAISFPRRFIAPEIDSEKIATKTSQARISYRVAKVDAEKAKVHSDSKSLRELGEYTFEYYMKMENIKNE